MCRKYQHDYFARKQFLGHIVEKNGEVQEKMEETSKANAIEYQVVTGGRIFIEIERRDGQSGVCYDYIQPPPSHIHKNSTWDIQLPLCGQQTPSVQCRYRNSLANILQIKLSMEASQAKSHFIL